jgi:hypothetical protein
MISSYNISTQNVATDGLLTFTTDRILTGCTVTRNGDTFQLNKPGYYYVTFNVDAAATAALGTLSIELYNNGVAVLGAEASSTTTVAGNLDNYAFATIIRVPPSCCAIDNTARLTVVNTGVPATISNANINITKLC